MTPNLPSKEYIDAIDVFIDRKHLQPHTEKSLPLEQENPCPRKKPIMCGEHEEVKSTLSKNPKATELPISNGNDLRRLRSYKEIIKTPTKKEFL